MVQAMKALQSSVKMRSPPQQQSRLGPLSLGEPPLEFPTLNQQIKEKRRQRTLMKLLQINAALSDDDSDFSEHSCVAP